MLITNYIILMHLLSQKQINFRGLDCLQLNFAEITTHF
jgi:hypothetical protein